MIPKGVTRTTFNDNLLNWVFEINPNSREDKSIQTRHQMMGKQEIKDLRPEKKKNDFIKAPLYVCLIMCAFLFVTISNIPSSTLLEIKRSGISTTIAFTFTFTFGLLTDDICRVGLIYALIIISLKCPYSIR